MIHQDIHMDRIKTLKPTVANDPHAISSPSSKSSRVAGAGCGGMLSFGSFGRFCA